MKASTIPGLMTKTQETQNTNQERLSAATTTTTTTTLPEEQIPTQMLIEWSETSPEEQALLKQALLKNLEMPTKFQQFYDEIKNMIN